MNDAATPPDGGKEASADEACWRIVAIELDERSIVRWTPEIEHERNVAIYDLLEENHFALASGNPGPYRLALSLRDATLVLEVTDGAGQNATITLSAKPLRRVIKDYFLICESYLSAIRGATPGRIEAIDMARRGLHNDGAELLKDALEAQVAIDGNTARRLFTLVCVLHLRG